MNIARMLCVPLGLLLLLWAGQEVLVHHLQSAPTSLYPPLKESLDRLTPQLKGTHEWKWDTADARRIEACEKSRAGQLKLIDFIPETFLLRYYDCVSQPLSVSVSLVHSEKGLDRRHHPEICLADVQGWREEPESRRLVTLATAAGTLETPQLQRFRFRARDLSQPVYTVYYWHYTVKAHDAQELSALQVFNGLFKQAPPSVSVQVWLAIPLDQLDRRPERESLVESSFLPALDRELRERHLPAKVRMQSDRIVMGLNR